MKLEKMKAPVSGHYIPTKHAAEIYGVVADSDMPQDFVDGVMFALAFLNCSAKKKMHGVGAAEFLANYQRNKAAADIPPEVRDAIEDILDNLAANGFEVVDCFLVQTDEVH